MAIEFAKEGERGPQQSLVTVYIDVYVDGSHQPQLSNASIGMKKFAPSSKDSYDETK
jgi:hypothetical protein